CNQASMTYETKPYMGHQVLELEKTELGLKIDGYGTYRHRKKRQRCLAHLIRKAIGISESINNRTARIGKLILDDLRDFIHAIKSGKKRAELD
ncbi:MAG: hypothetical protein AAF652_19565, partial [Cyanobacteria bacterium P01_C01_bin.72]